MFNSIKIKKNELAIVYQDNEFAKVLRAGQYIMLRPFSKINYQIVDLNNALIDPVLTEYLLNFCPEVVEKECISLTLAKNEIALYLENNQLIEILAANNNYLVWKKSSEQTLVPYSFEDDGRLNPQDAKNIFELIENTAEFKHNNVLNISQIKQTNMAIWSVNQAPVDIIANNAVIAFDANKKDCNLSLFDVDEVIDQKTALLLQQFIPEKVAEYCEIMTVSPQEAGLRYYNDVLMEILAPASQLLYWKQSRQRLKKVHCDYYYRAPDYVVEQLVQPRLRQEPVIGQEAVLLAKIPAFFAGILKVNGKVEALLEPGINAYWRFSRDIELETVDTRLQVLDVSGQEILTKDKVNLRINLLANWRYSDILKAYSTITEPDQLLYRELQFALRQAVGTRTLDELLENKEIIDTVVMTHIKASVHQYGMEILSVGVKDIILPGDMKDILAQVVQAEKSAQANVIRRREETAATRSLLNTAKVMENNPVALRLKEMETLERVAEQINHISVVGGLDQVLTGLVNIKAQ